MVRYAIEKRFMHACRQSFVKAAIGWGRGLEKRDIAHNINFFMNVPVTPEGGLTFQDGVSGPGKYVELRAEMDVLAVISNCPQLNNVPGWRLRSGQIRRTPGGDGRPCRHQ
jgi:uncharacterized protein YcgI (DUF1989 family)